MLSRGTALRHAERAYKGVERYRDVAAQIYYDTRKKSSPRSRHHISSLYLGEPRCCFEVSHSFTTESFAEVSKRQPRTPAPPPSRKRTAETQPLCALKFIRVRSSSFSSSLPLLLFPSLLPVLAFVFRQFWEFSNGGGRRGAVRTGWETKCSEQGWNGGCIRPSSSSSSSFQFVCDTRLPIGEEREEENFV